MNDLLCTSHANGINRLSHVGEDAGRLLKAAALKMFWEDGSLEGDVQIVPDRLGAGVLSAD